MEKKERVAKGIMLISGVQVRKYLSLREAMDAVEKAYTQFCEGKTLLPPVVNMELRDRKAELDVKCAYFPAFEMIGVKLAAGFYQNDKFSLPSWPSIMVVTDGETGFASAVMDGGYLTTVRTGAAGAVAAKYLARRDSETALILGAGNQARIQLSGLTEVLPKLKRVFVYSEIPEELARYGADMSPCTGLEIIGVPGKGGLADAAGKADVIVTVTPSKQPLLMREWIRPGTHINAIGADGPGKQELDPKILRDADKVVADSFSQTRRIGECQHAVAAGYMSIDGAGLYAEIGEITGGKKPGRERAEEITVFDATGMAVLDVAAAAIVCERAEKDPDTPYFKMFNV